MQAGARRVEDHGIGGPVFPGEAFGGAGFEAATFADAIRFGVLRRKRDGFRVDLKPAISQPGRCLWRRCRKTKAAIEVEEAFGRASPKRRRTASCRRSAITVLVWKTNSDGCGSGCRRPLPLEPGFALERLRTTARAREVGRERLLAHEERGRGERFAQGVLAAVVRRFASFTTRTMRRWLVRLPSRMRT